MSGWLAWGDSAIETHITVAALFLLRQIYELVGESKAMEFAMHFAKTRRDVVDVVSFIRDARVPDRLPALEPLRGVQLFIGYRLHQLAAWMYEALGTGPPWPYDDADWVRERRNELVHRTIVLLPPREPYILPRPDGTQRKAAISLMEDLGGEWLMADLGDEYCGYCGLVKAAERAFETMVVCCRDCLQSAAKLAWAEQSDSDTKDESIRRLVERMPPPPG